MFFKIVKKMQKTEKTMLHFPRQKNATTKGQSPEQQAVPYSKFCGAYNIASCQRKKEEKIFVIILF